MKTAKPKQTKADQNYLRILYRHAKVLRWLGVNLFFPKQTWGTQQLDGRGIYFGAEWDGPPDEQTRHVARLRIVLTGADLYRITAEYRTDVPSNVVSLLTKLPMQAEGTGKTRTIDRVFADDLELVLLHLFGIEPQLNKGPGGAWNTEEQ